MITPSFRRFGLLIVCIVLLIVPVLFLVYLFISVGVPVSDGRFKPACKELIVCLFFGGPILGLVNFVVLCFWIWAFILCLPIGLFWVLVTDRLHRK